VNLSVRFFFTLSTLVTLPLQYLCGVISFFSTLVGDPCTNTAFFPRLRSATRRKNDFISRTACAPRSEMPSRIRRMVLADPFRMFLLRATAFFHSIWSRRHCARCLIGALLRARCRSNPTACAVGPGSATGKHAKAARKYHICVLTQGLLRACKHAREQKKSNSMRSRTIP
jgi:hypothetical protein